MEHNTDNGRVGYETALARIAAEREARAGRLDLSNLGLTRPPLVQKERDKLAGHATTIGNLRARRERIAAL